MGTTELSLFVLVSCDFCFFPCELFGISLQVEGCIFYFDLLWKIVTTIWALGGPQGVPRGQKSKKKLKTLNFKMISKGCLNVFQSIHK